MSEGGGEGREGKEEDEKEEEEMEGMSETGRAWENTISLVLGWFVLQHWSSPACPCCTLQGIFGVSGCALTLHW